MNVVVLILAIKLHEETLIDVLPTTGSYINKIIRSLLFPQDCSDHLTLEILVVLQYHVY